MLNTSFAEREAWRGGSPKQLVLAFTDNTTLTNADIAEESMSLEQAISEDSQLRFGNCSAACFKVRVHPGATRYKGKRFTARLTAGTYSRLLGTFTVELDTATADHIWRELTCYDDLYLILQTNYADWHNSLTFPMTVKQYRDAFFTHVGITQQAITLCNDNISISRNFVADTFSGADVLQSICEINGAFGHLDYDGSFRYVVLAGQGEGLYPANNLYPANTLYPRDTVQARLDGDSGAASYYQDGLTYEEYSVEPVTQVQIRQTADDIGAVVGTAGNTYVIEDNPLMYGKTTAELTVIAQNFLNTIGNIVYTPGSVETRGAPYIQLGDLIGINTSTGEVILYVLHRILSGISSLNDTYTASGEREYTDQANGTNRSVKALRQRTNELVRTVDETVSRITSVETDLDDEITTRQTEIRQTAEAIALKVSKGDVSSEISQESGTITIRSNRFVLQSDNCSITADGKITASNAQLTGTVQTGDTGYNIKISANAIEATNNGLLATGALYFAEDLNSDGYHNVLRLRSGRIVLESMGLFVDSGRVLYEGVNSRVITELTYDSLSSIVCNPSFTTRAFVTHVYSDFSYDWENAIQQMTYTPYNISYLANYNWRSTINGILT